MGFPIPRQKFTEEKLPRLLSALKAEFAFHDMEYPADGTPLEKAANLLLKANRENPIAFLCALTERDEFHGNVELQRLTAEVFAHVQLHQISGANLAIG